MSEKLSDSEVNEVLRSLQSSARRQIRDIDEMPRKYREHARRARKLVNRRAFYERRIAALDAVLAERRERKNSA